MPIPGRVLFFIVLALLPAIGGFIALAIVARSRGNALWTIPGWLAAAALAPVLAAHFAVRLLISAFQNLGHAGGIGAASAGMLEATQPLIWTSFVACALAIVTSIIAFGTLAKAGEGGNAAKGLTLSAVAIVAVFAGLAATGMLFNGTSRMVIDLIDPRMAQTVEMRGVAGQISSRLVMTSGIAVGMTLLLGAAIVVSALIRHARQPSRGVALVLALTSAAAAVAFAVSGLLHKAWAAKLYETAVSGQFPR